MGGTGFFLSEGFHLLILLFTLYCLPALSTEANEAVLAAPSLLEACTEERHALGCQCDFVFLLGPGNKVLTLFKSLLFFLAIHHSSESKTQT